MTNKYNHSLVVQSHEIFENQYRGFSTREILQWVVRHHSQSLRPVADQTKIP